MSTILVISFSDLARDSRVDRQIGFLRENHHVIAAGLAAPAYEDVEFIDLARDGQIDPGSSNRLIWASRLVRARVRPASADAVYWSRPEHQAAWRLLHDVRADAVIANDVPALPLAIRIARAAPVIFDAHEMATTEWAHVRWWRLLMAPYIDALLRSYLPRVAAMMTVCDGIADMYERRYRIDRPAVVTNAPAFVQLAPSPVHTPVRLIHHGTAEPGRRLELMIEACDGLNGRYMLDLMLVPGDAAYLEHLRQLVADRASVRVIEPKPQRDIVAHCNQYDVGVFVLPPLNDNWRLALPNKLFEFIQARLAVVVGPSPEMAHLVRSHGVGAITDDFTAGALGRALLQLTPDSITSFKNASDVAAAELNSERNAEIVGNLVDQALGKPSPLNRVRE